MNPIRFFLLLSFAMALPFAARAQTGDLTFVWPKTAGLRAGDLSPQLTLPVLGAAAFDSRALLGQNSLFLLLDNAPNALALDETVAGAAQSAEKRGIVTAVVSEEPSPAPKPIFSLRAPKNALKTVSKPSFLVIDRAGWLREIEALPATKDDPQNVQLRFLLSQTPDPTPVLEVGKIAPDFSFPDMNGQWRRVSALRGRKNLLLTFFPKCFTGRCQSHLSSLRDQFPGFLATQTEIWAVSIDPAEGERGQKAFAESLNLPFPLLPDVGHNICLLYGANQSPTQLAIRQSVFIDKNGIVRFIDKQVNAPTHGEDMLAKITAMGVLP